jgi:predicted transcriptional regulator
LCRNIAWRWDFRYLDGMLVHFPPELEAKVLKSAAEQGRDTEEFIQELVARHFDDENHFLDAIQRGEDALEHGEFLTHEQVGQRLERFLKR